ncbi:fumarylacetoacetase [bacterium]|nr:fumarylacetoacetase [bacterium]
MNPTNDPGLRSFIEVPKDSHFPIQNLPYGVFRSKSNQYARVGVAIGNQVLDLGALELAGLFKNTALDDMVVFNRRYLNGFMALGRPFWQEVRARISELLRHDNPELRDNQTLRKKAFIPMDKVEMLLPVNIGDYTDFYSSREHATNVGTMFRGKDNALMPNWLHLPVAYHGRASSIVISGTDIRRPHGQVLPKDAAEPVFSPSHLLDFELEMGFFVGPGSELGYPISAENAMDHIFGMVLVNDWSARDIQKWEYQPLGPFNAKNFATTISPWIVTMDALDAFKVTGPVQAPPPLPYLKSNRESTYDIKLDVSIQSEKMDAPYTVCRSNFKHLYWNIRQQLAHHTITGCNVRPGDMMASGTISGPDKSSFGSMLELTWRGTEPIQLPSGEERKFLNDGDTVVISGYCEGNEYRVGFGEAKGKLLPVKS